MIGMRAPIPGLFDHPMSTRTVLEETIANATGLGLCSHVLDLVIGVIGRNRRLLCSVFRLGHRVRGRCVGFGRSDLLDIVLIIVGLGLVSSPRCGDTSRAVSRSTTGASSRTTLFALREFLIVELGEHHGDVTGSLVDPGRPAPSSRPPPLEGGTLVGPALGDVELVCDQILVVLSVGHRALEHLGDHVRSAALAEFESIAGPVQILVPDQIQYDAGLGRRQTSELVGRTGSGDLVEVDQATHRRPPRSWPAWNLNVRVGANSPSLCPTIDSVM